MQRCCVRSISQRRLSCTSAPRSARVSLRALQSRSEDWRRRAEQVFFAGDRVAIGGYPSIPRNEASFSHLIEIFVLEKSLYKIYYEAPNRLGCIHSPLAGV